MHKARFSQLLPLLTGIEETLEALSVLQELTSSKEQFFLLIILKKYCNIFLQNQLTLS